MLQQKDNLEGIVTVAVTGGVACGKSFVSSHLLDSYPEEQILRFDCDAAVGELLESRQVSERIANLESKVMLDESSGLVEKVTLRKLAFENERFREKLEDLLHPLVLERVRACIANARESVRIALIEVPLLYEASFPLERDFDLVVAASGSTQMKRLSEVRKLELNLARKIIEAQMPLHEKIIRGDVVVWNDGDISSLEVQIGHLTARCAALFEK